MHSHVVSVPKVASITRRDLIGLVVAMKTSTASGSGKASDKMSLGGLLAKTLLLVADSMRLAVTSCRNSFWMAGDRAMMSLADRVMGRLRR